MNLGVYVYGKPWIGDGLLFSSGAKWARNRRLLTPAFHFAVLKPYVVVKNKAMELFMVITSISLQYGTGVISLMRF